MHDFILINAVRIIAHTRYEPQFTGKDREAELKFQS